VSNFLLWQGSYSEYYVTPIYWPDFDEAEFHKALETYAQRRRRYGKTGRAGGAGGPVGQPASACHTAAGRAPL
jgi:hypothetical protein